MDALRKVTWQEAAELLRSGEVIAIPTETVYGLAARIDAAEAVERIYELKGREGTKALIALVASAEQARGVVAEWPALAERLAEVFWPGALTIVLPRGECVSDVVSGGLGTVGVRVPGHELVLGLLGEVGPVASTSANKSGGTSPTCAEDVEKVFLGTGLCVMDGGACDVGMASTVVEIRDGGVAVLRAGAVSAEQMRDVVGDCVRD